MRNQKGQPETLLGLPIKYVDRDKFSKVQNAPLYISDEVNLKAQFKYEVGSDRLWMQILPNIETDMPIEFVLINGVKYKLEKSDGS